MSNYNNTNSGQTFGIVGFIFAILAFIFAFIPCIGIVAIIPGVFALIFSALGLSQANRANAAKGLIIAALVLSIISILVASIWGLFLVKVSKENNYFMKGENVEIMYDDRNDLDELDDLAKNLEDKLDSINLDEINITIDGNELSKEEKETLRESAKNAGNEIKNSIKEFVKDIKKIEESKKD